MCSNAYDKSLMFSESWQGNLKNDMDKKKEQPEDQIREFADFLFLFVPQWLRELQNRIFAADVLWL